jgi:hypothetical protein
MANPLDKVRKLRSLGEAITRGGQAISAFREQRRGGPRLPTDEELAGLIDRSQFGRSPVIAESLWQRFYKNGDEHFFAPFRSRAVSTTAFKELFRGPACTRFINSAENIVEGRIDLLGLKNLYVGADIDWHREPLSAKRSPLKHWKEFDDVDTAETGNKKIIWELNRHQHFFTLGVAFWLTGDERYGETFARHLESWMEQNPPGLGINWSSSLEVAFRAMSWVWAFHFFRDSVHFTPDLFKQALKYLYLHGRHIERYLSTYYSPNTHLTGEGLGLYYLGTQLPFFTRAEHWRTLGEEIMFGEIERQVLPDGVYFEQSTWYQRYTVDFFSHFLVLRSLRPEPNLNGELAGAQDRLEKAFDFLMHLTMPDGTTPLIGDDDGGRMLPITTADPDDFRGSLAVAAVLFDRGDLKHVAGDAGEELFWLLGTKGLVKYETLETSEPQVTSVAFPDGGYIVMRDGWEDTDNCLVVDCGAVGSLAGGHGHADALAIELAVHGQTLLVDSGTYTYHESRELRDHFRSTMAHNTVTVDGRSSSEPGGTFGWQTRALAEQKTWIAGQRFGFFEGSHNGYERLEDAATHTRSILFLKNDYWIIRDLVEAKGEHEYALNFHYAHDVRPGISFAGDCVGDADHRVYTFNGSGHWDQKESWISNNHGNRVNAPFLRYISRGAGTQEFFTFILPVTRGVASPEVSEFVSYAGRAFVIRSAGYTDLFVFNDDTTKLIDAGVFDTAFRYTWMRLTERESLPDEFVAIDGDALKIGSTVVIDGAKTQFASGRRFGSEFYIRTDAGRSKVPFNEPS